MSNAYIELYSSNDVISNICKFGCDVMYQLADFFNCTYGEINIFLLYIVQPLIYIALSIHGKYILFKRYSKILSCTLLSVDIMLLLILIRDFFGKNFDVLCIEKIDSIYNFAHQSGMTYAEFNVYTFIVEFIIICLSHIFVVNLKQYRIIYMLLCIALTLMSPNFVMVWYT